jgi:hypothetical protein
MFRFRFPFSSARIAALERRVDAIEARCRMRTPVADKPVLLLDSESDEPAAGGVAATRAYAQRVLPRPALAAVAPLLSTVAATAPVQRPLASYASQDATYHVCGWCARPIDAGRTECERCALTRPSQADDPDLDEGDADLVFACDRCGGLGASPESGLCQRCEGGRARP